MPEQVRWEGRVSVRNALKSIALMRNRIIDIDKLIQIVGLSAKSDHL